jgi:TolB-like protein/cytochrome c-type biogenesis protein CcmH/NrfG
VASKLSTFLAELKRRKVYHVAVVYLVVGFAVAQGAQFVFEFLGFPPGSWRFVTLLILLGFPIALVLAWAYEVRPEQTGERERTEGEPKWAEEVEAPSADVGSKTIDLRSIAVLPFDNLSNDPENEYFSDGITEDILTHLSRIGSLRVTSRTSAMAYKGTRKQMGEIAAELSVGTVLEGSVRRAGDRVRVTAQLIDASTDKHLWADTYDRDLEDIFEVQSAIAEMIAGALRAELTPEVAKRIRRHPTDNIDAYDHFLRGREAFRRSNADDAVAALEEAVTLDPEFAAAYGALAGAYVQSMYWHGASPKEVLPKAKEAVSRALELDEGQALSWSAKGAICYHLDRDWAGAEAALTRARELDPHDADIILWYGHHLACQRRFDEAIQAFREGVATDPHNTYNRSWIGFSQVMKGDPEEQEEAEEHLREAIARDPSNHETQQFLGWSLLCWGRFEEGAEQFALCHELVPNPFYLVLRTLALSRVDPELDVTSALGEVRGAVEEIEFHEALAMMAVLEDDVELALDHLETAEERRSPVLPWFRSTSILAEPFEGHPRFEQINRKIFGPGA